MRMPLSSHFLVVGAVLFGGLILVSGQLASKPLPVSQRIDVPPPFKARILLLTPTFRTRSHRYVIPNNGGRFAILLLRSEALALKLAQDRLHSPPILIAVLNHRRQ